MAIFENFRLLKESMQNEGWIIDAFAFQYKTTNYIVLVKLYMENENRPKYALLKTEFLKESNFANRLIVPVNINGFMIETKILRNFFAIEYSENLGNILQQFNEYFSKFIPVEVNISKPDSLIQPMLNSLSKSDSEDPEKRYCFKVKRNPKGELRTVYNDNKTKILRTKLYETFEKEKTISFCYSKDILTEKTDEEILLNFSKRENSKNYR
ncbi:DUF6037 family protein [Fluviicola taffensis]|uniref:DUF6037 family protein n=1 Tax=Fluviicola taffensis TaxID=191579 RepID=UPI0031380DD8